jgi:calcineurin-like phosphoesterase family protein
VGIFLSVVFMSDIWMTSDQHFNHSKIIDYCDRPFDDVTEMNNALVQKYNEHVSTGDVVYHLGDIGFGKMVFKYIDQLNGKKILIKGNHDRSFSNRDLLQHFSSVHPTLRLTDIPKYEAIDLIHDPAQYRGDNFLVNGHVHDKWKVFPGKLNVGVDVWHFRPVHLDEVIEKIDSDRDTRDYNISKRGWHDWFDHIEELEEKLELQKKLDRDHIMTIIQGALKNSIHEHGKITKNDLDSASKRIYGQLKGYFRGEQ